MTIAFVPIESWVIQRHLEWETMFLLPDITDSLASSIVSTAMFSQIVSILVGYKVGLHLLKSHGIQSLIRASIVTLSIFFTAIGLFYDTLLYPGTSEEYHRGDTATLAQFLISQRCRDAYITFSLVFGPPFFCLSLYWNSGYKKKEKFTFVLSLYKEVLQTGLMINMVYFIMWGLGAMPLSYGIYRLAVTNGVFFIAHFSYITPLLLCSTQKEE